VKFTEINLFGVYVAPMSVMLVVAWLVTIALRRIAARFGLLRNVWHPATFVFAVYMGASRPLWRPPAIVSFLNP
jgi:hypothetical protein